MRSRIISSIMKGYSRIRSAFHPEDDKRASKPYPKRLRITRPDIPPRIGERLNYRQIQFLLTDTQVRVAYQTLEYLLLSKEFILTRPDDTEESQMVYDFIDKALRGMRTDLRSLRRNLYKALVYGQSIQEVIYKVEGGRVVPERTVPVHPATVTDDSFIYNDEGEFMGVRQTQTDYATIPVQASEVIPPEKLLIYSFDPEFDDPRGQSILYTLYDNVDMKHHALRWLLIYLQKYENPVLIGKVGNPQYKDDLLAQLESIEEGLSKITIGREDDVMVVESQHHGDAFFEFIKYNDNMILRRFFLGTLLYGQSDKASGSYSQSQTQLEVTRMILDGIHEDIARAIQGLIDRLVAWNFGERYLKHAPRAGFERLMEKDLHGVLEALQPYATSLLIDTSAEWFINLLEKYLGQATGLNLNLHQDEDAGLEELPVPDEAPEAESLEESRSRLKALWRR